MADCFDASRRWTPGSPRLRRDVLRAGAAIALAPALRAARAQATDNWPTHPLRMVVPFAPGGVTDTSGRLIAEMLSKHLGQQIIVDNRQGASGNIGTSQVATAPADGYTLLLGFDGTMVINPSVFPNVPFDTLRDFAPAGKIGDAQLVLVAHPAVAARTLPELIALSKSTPGGLPYGTSGTGSTPHVAGELLKQRTGANLQHIPYKGGGQAMADALGGAIPLVYTAVAGAHGHIASGKLRAIAVSSAQRTSALPNVPTFIESGISDFVVNSWVGVFVAAKTPPAILARLNRDLNTVLGEKETLERLRVMGIEATPGTPAVFREQIASDLVRFEGVVKQAGIRVES